MFGFIFCYIMIVRTSVSMATVLYPSPCLSGDLWCTNGVCLFDLRVCDGRDDCGDNSDERSCQGCNDRTFSCGNGQCIQPDKVCDDSCDCSNCLDEERVDCFNKTSPSPCDTRNFWCSNNSCRLKQWVCDGHDDCFDNSDERSCSGCGRGTFSCSNGTTPSPVTCIDPALVCDKVCDCDNCSDESECYEEPPEPPKKSYFSFNPVMVVPIVFLLGTSIYCLRIVIKKRYRDWVTSRVENNQVNNSSASTQESETAEPEILDNSPPDYDVIADNPVFLFDSQSLYDETDENLPTYEEANYFAKFNTSDNNNLPPPPSYDTIHSLNGSEKGVPANSENNISEHTDTTMLNPSLLQSDGILNFSYADEEITSDSVEAIPATP